MAGSPRISLAGDHPSHGTGDGVDGDLDGYIGVEVIDGVYQNRQRGLSCRH